jgi:hypothetical protein
MYMSLPPTDFQVRCASKVHSSVTEPTITTAAYPSVHRAPESWSPSDRLIQLEETRDLALKAQHNIQIPWNTSTHNISPARSALPDLSLELYSDITFCRLQCLVKYLDSRLVPWIAKPLGLDCSDTLRLRHVAAVVGHGKECLAGFNHMWLRLAPRVLSPLLCKFAWSKEGYDLLESALRTIQKLGKQLDDIHHGIQGLLEPQKASGITKLGIGVTSANVEFPRHQTQSNLRRRGGNVVKASCGISDFRDGTCLLYERMKLS